MQHFQGTHLACGMLGAGLLKLCALPPLLGNQPVRLPRTQLLCNQIHVHHRDPFGANAYNFQTPANCCHLRAHCEAKGAVAPNVTPSPSSWSLTSTCAYCRVHPSPFGHQYHMCTRALILIATSRAPFPPILRLDPQAS
eukprot:1149683-Pelagomonas_calceolata.AAC.1